MYSFAFAADDVSSLHGKNDREEDLRSGAQLRSIGSHGRRTPGALSWDRLANLVMLFTPEAIVLGGNVMRSADLLMEGIEGTIRRHCSLVPSEKIQIRLASLGAQAGLIGAARAWHNRLGQSES